MSAERISSQLLNEAAPLYGPYLLQEGVDSPHEPEHATARHESEPIPAGELPQNELVCLFPSQSELVPSEGGEINENNNIISPDQPGQKSSENTLAIRNSDDPIVYRKKNGDIVRKSEIEVNGECITKVYEKYHPSMTQYALKLTHNEQEAQDLVQDAYLKMLIGGHIDLDQNPESYAIKTVKHVFYDKIRHDTSDKRDIRKTERFDDPQTTHYTSNKMSVEEEVILNDEIRIRTDILCQKIESSKNKGRDLDILIGYIQGYTHSEIASSVSIPIGTVKTIIRRYIQQVNGAIKS